MPDTSSTKPSTLAKIFLLRPAQQPESLETYISELVRTVEIRIFRRHGRLTGQEVGCGQSLRTFIEISPKPRKLQKKFYEM